MKKCILIIGATALSVWTAAAEEVPKVGVYLGYEYVRFNSQSDIQSLQTSIPSFNGHGAGGQFIYNFNGWLGGVFDAGAVHNVRCGEFQTRRTIVNFVAVPPLSFPTLKPVPPSLPALLLRCLGASRL